MRVWEGTELPDSDAAEVDMGFIQRARLVEMQKKAARAAAAQRSNTTNVPQPPLQAGNPEPEAHARRLPRLNYLGDATAFEGQLRAQGDLKIDGDVEGVVHQQEGCLTIGADAKVEADLVVRDVVIAGLVVGNVDASGKVEIHAGGTLRGDLRTRRIHIHDGGVVIGNVDMGEDRIAGQSDPLPKRTPAKVAPKNPETAA
jgi:cytoskeletal protein CcmA (bactofilin family)